MREILYRGRRVDNGELVEGVYLPKPQPSIGVYNEEGKYWIWYDVVPETVGEYTGLKDKNGAKVFEGDVVVGKFNQEEIIGHIVYGSDACYYISRKGIFGIGLNNAEDWLKVIGNVHDNPELMEEKK